MARAHRDGSYCRGVRMKTAAGSPCWFLPQGSSPNRTTGASSTPPKPPHSSALPVTLIALAMSVRKGNRALFLPSAPQPDQPWVQDPLGHPQQDAGTCPQERAGRTLVSMGHSVALSLCPASAPLPSLRTPLAQFVAQFLPLLP